MKNFIRAGDVSPITAPSGGVTSGDYVEIGALSGVAAGSAAIGETVEIQHVGVFALPKTAGAGTALVVGDAVEWSSGDSAFQAVDAGARRGVVTAPAGDADATVEIRLDP